MTDTKTFVRIANGFSFPVDFVVRDSFLLEVFRFRDLGPNQYVSVLQSTVDGWGERACFFYLEPISREKAKELKVV